MMHGQKNIKMCVCVCVCVHTDKIIKMKGREQENEGLKNQHIMDV